MMYRVRFTNVFVSQNTLLSRLSNNSVLAFDSCFRLRRRECCQKKNGPWVCDISRSPSRPRPTVLLNPRPFLVLISSLSLLSFFSFFLMPEPRRSRFCLSLAYLVSHGSQLRVLSGGLLDNPWSLVQNSRSASGGRLGILIHALKYRKSRWARKSLRNTIFRTF